MNELNKKTWNTTSAIIYTEKLCETIVTEKIVILFIIHVELSSFIPKKI